jgi:hypothetical protein
METGCSSRKVAAAEEVMSSEVQFTDDERIGEAMAAKYEPARAPGSEGRAMPLFMDVHNKVDGVTAEAVAGAHKKDVEIQDRHGVKYLKYWIDESTGRIFCLADAPNKEAAIRVHREAHGLLADEIFEVKEGS